MREKKLPARLNVILIKNELLFYIMISDHYDIMTQNDEWQICDDSASFSHKDTETEKKLIQTRLLLTGPKPLQAYLT